MKKTACLLLMILFSGICNYSFARPLIGLTALFSQNKVQLNQDYVLAIVENGGVPVILPPTGDEVVIARYVKMLDAVVLTGGMDIPPDLYQQKLHYSTKVMSPVRAGFEEKFIKAFVKSKKPVLGICLGMQFTNVLSGGSMFQDIPSMIGKKVSHRNGEMYTNFHHVGIARGSRLEKILGTTSTRVISRHHQAVDRVAEIFAVAARSSDGVIEALERKDGPFGILVQWHPESMKDADPEHRNRLFKALIEAAGQP